MGGKLLLLHQQRLVELTLVLLDLLLHVGDCTCNLGESKSKKNRNEQKMAESRRALYGGGNLRVRLKGRTANWRKGRKFADVAEGTDSEGLGDSLGNTGAQIKSKAIKRSCHNSTQWTSVQHCLFP